MNNKYLKHSSADLLTLCDITRRMLMKFFLLFSIKAVLLLIFFFIYIYFASYYLMPKLSTVTSLQDLL